MDERGSILSQEVIEEVKRFPTAQLVALLFPGHPVRRSGSMRSPFREDRKPSFSCFQGRGGFSFWKDHTTGESGDNIDFYRKVFPELGYVDAVDGLSRLVLGHGAISDVMRSARSVYAVPQARQQAARRIEPERGSVWEVVSDVPATDASVPQELRDYWRGRGISDAAVFAFGCRCVVVENGNRKGRTLLDPSSGLPLLDRDGNAVVDDARTVALAIYNDIGGLQFRGLDTPARKGVKSGTSSFIATRLADDSMPRHVVSFTGEGSNTVEHVIFDARTGKVHINATQCFCHVPDAAARLGVPFLSRYDGVTLDARDVKCLVSVFDALSAPWSDEVVVVEGMFDALSERELARSSGHHRDIVVANSISHLHWAVPFICKHRRAVLLLDNDLSSGAGQKACARLRKEVAEYGRLTSTVTEVLDGSKVFAGYKDLNEALMARKGFPVSRRGDDDPSRRKGGGPKR